MVLIVLYNSYYTFDILSINSQTQVLKLINVYFLNLQTNLSELLGILILGAAFIKSAQFGGHA